MKERPGAGFIFYRIVHGEPRFLLIRSARNPNRWDFVKGGVEGNETRLACAWREAYEEAGYSPGDYDHHESFRTVWEYTNNHGVYRKIVLFLAECNKDPELSDEHIMHEYVTLTQAEELLRFDEQKNCLREASAYIQNIKMS
jgi:8-oxo-dGTP pyrophosphatase MutT (NUDIX family)